MLEHVEQEVEKLEDTGFTDKCMFCGKENKVENMVYGENYNNSWQILCENCEHINIRIKGNYGLN